jgi:restriction endonuclease S subunit
MATTQDFANWVCGQKIMPEYLLYVFRSMGEEFKRLIMGSTHKTIYMPDVATFVTPLPPLHEQNLIVQYVQKKKQDIERLKSAVSLSIAKLEEYRTALISAAVTGKIDVRKDVA